MNLLFSRRRPAGFTLIELLTVIAIIGILAAIVIATVGTVRRNAHQARSLSNLRQMGTAIQLYANDNRTRLPVWRLNDGTGDRYWWRQIMPYLGDSKEIFHDPGHAAYDATTDEIMHQNFSYGWNYAVTGLQAGIEDTPDHVIKLSDVFDPPRTLMVSISAATESYGFISDAFKLPDPKRYNGKAPSVFLDGHVSARPVQEFNQTQPWFVQIKPVP